MRFAPFRVAVTGIGVTTNNWTAEKQRCTTAFLFSSELHWTSDVFIQLYFTALHLWPANMFLWCNLRDMANVVRRNDNMRNNNIFLLIFVLHNIQYFYFQWFHCNTHVSPWSFSSGTLPTLNCQVMHIPQKFDGLHVLYFIISIIDARICLLFGFW